MLRGFRVRLSRPKVLLGVLLLLLLAAAAVGVGAPASSAAPSAAAKEEPPCAPLTEFDADNFSDPTTIDNELLPLSPGTRTVLEGRADRGGGPLPHQVIFVVTDVTKVIDGVRTVAVWDRDVQDGVLAEEELAFFAQDDDGNVWNLGEYPEEHEGGVFVGAPSTWISGIQDAIGGVHMSADPSNGTNWTLYGFAPAIDFFDCGKVWKTGETTCVPVDCYEDVLVTNEVSPPAAGGGHQRKYHAPGVGIVQVGAVGDKEGETLVLTERTQLTAAERAAARNRALQLDANGYVNSPDVYGLTAPAS